MGDMFMWISVILLFLGLPASIIVTIIAFIKKNTNSLFKLSVPMVIGAILFFTVFGAILLPDSELETQVAEKTEKEETSENDTESEQESKKETKKPEKTKTENKENNKKEEKPKKITESEYKGLCQEYNYKDVLRNPEKYIGKKIVITLEISTVKQESWANPTKYYFAYSESEPGSGFFYGDRYAVFDERENQDDLKILEDDIIKVWGEISEPQETSSLIVNSEELFCIDMKYVELISE